jgi:hypothetical protein
VWRSKRRSMKEYFMMTCTRWNHHDWQTKLLILYCLGHECSPNQNISAFVFLIWGDSILEYWQIWGKLTFFFGGTGVWSLDLMFGRQALHLLRHTPTRFCFSFFSDRMLYFCLGLALDLDLPLPMLSTITGKMCYHT